MKFTSIVFISCVAILAPDTSVDATNKFSRRRTLINDEDKTNNDAAVRVKRTNNHLLTSRVSHLRKLEEVGSMPSSIVQTASEEVDEKVPSSSSLSCPAWGEFRNQYPAIGRTTIELVDKSRNGRTLAADVWYPAENNGEQLSNYMPMRLPASMTNGLYVALDSPRVLTPPQDNGTIGYPLLIFSMGADAMRIQSSRLMEHLASWGFVVVSPDHPGNSFDDPTFSNIPFKVEDRPKDISLVIDYMLSPEYVDRFHLQHALDNGVGVLGHSYGGLTSLLVAPNAQEWSDNRVKAIVPISPTVEASDEEIQNADVDFGEGISAELIQKRLPNVVVPTMVIGGENDIWTPVDRHNLAVYEKTNGLPRWNVVIPHAGHISFADTCPMFDKFAWVLGLGEDLAYTMMGGGDKELGKDRMSQSFCDNNDEVISLLGYYTVAFFSAMLLLEGDERDHAIECMNAQSDSLSTYEFLDV